MSHLCCFGGFEKMYWLLKLSALCFKRLQLQTLPTYIYPTCVCQKNFPTAISKRNLRNLCFYCDYKLVLIIEYILSRHIHVYLLPFIYCYNWRTSYCWYIEQLPCMFILCKSTTFLIFIISNCDSEVLKLNWFVCN